MAACGDLWEHHIRGWIGSTEREAIMPRRPGDTLTQTILAGAIIMAIVSALVYMKL